MQQKLTKAWLSALLILALLCVPVLGSVHVQALDEATLIEWENLNNSVISADPWGGYSAANAGKWMQLDASLAADTEAETPSGDDKSLHANLAYGYEAFARDYANTNKLGQYDGVYLTLWAEKDFDLVFLMEFLDGGSFFGREVMGTVIQVKTGWNTYYITNAALKSATSLGGQTASWNLASVNHVLNGEVDSSNPNAYLARIQFTAPRGAVPANLVSSTGNDLTGNLNAANPDETALQFKIDSLGVYDGAAPQGGMKSYEDCQSKYSRYVRILLKEDPEPQEPIDICDLLEMKKHMIEKHS